MTLEWLEGHQGLVTVATALLAIVISAFSLALGFVSIWMERRNFSLSIRPLAAINLGDYENELFVVLQNLGVGPLRITKLQVLRDSELIGTSLIDEMPALPEGLFWSTFVGSIEKRALAAGGQIFLLRLQAPASANTDRFAESLEKVRSRLADLTLRVEYVDIRGKAMTPEKRALSWFARHSQPKKTGWP